MSDQPIVFLKGKRVYLRPLCRDDTPLLLRWMNDPEVSLYLMRYLPLTEMEEEKWMENQGKHPDRGFVLMICLLQDDRPIGTMSLNVIDWRSQLGGTGASIGEKDCWGKGYGTEAKMLLLHYAFTRMNLRKICSGVLAFNKRSKRYNEKCGYGVEGVCKSQYFIDGRFVDEILMAVFKKDFMPLWKEYKKKYLS